MKKLFLSLSVVAAICLPASIKAQSVQESDDPMPVGQESAAASAAAANAAATAAATDSIKAILTSAKAGDAKSQNIVGGWFYRGKHVKQDYTQALQWWSKAAKQGYPEAIGNMGLCYQTGHGVEADSLTAVQLYTQSIKKGNKLLLAQTQKAADKGNLFSQVFTAYCYQQGLGTQKDATKAMQYYEIAAKRGSVQAQRELGILLLNARKGSDALNWFKKAAEKGDIASSFYYGRILYDGIGVAKDPERGAIQLLKAAEAGFPNAMYLIGQAYYSGNGVTKNSQQGFNWMLKAAQNGISNAQYQVGMAYANGDGTDVNFERAMNWLAKAVQKGHKIAFQKAMEPDSALYSTPFHDYLLGVKAYSEKDFESALKYFKNIAKTNPMEAKTWEGLILSNKDYKKFNTKKGIETLTKAAESDPYAQFLLGAIYEDGSGVTADMPKAISLLTSSADAGNPEAMCYLGNIYFEGRGVEKSYEEAVRYYEMAKGQLSLDAAKHLADCYENGYGGLTVDKKEAEKLLKGNYNNPVPALLDLVQTPVDKKKKK